MKWTWAGVLLLLLTLALGLAACGRPSTNVRPTAASPTVTPAAGPGGIASGAAVGNVPGIAPAAPPPPEAGNCPAANPVKVGPDYRAYEPSRADYAAVQAIACFPTLAAAAA